MIVESTNPSIGTTLNTHLRNGAEWLGHVVKVGFDYLVDEVCFVWDRAIAWSKGKADNYTLLGVGCFVFGAYGLTCKKSRKLACIGLIAIGLAILRR